MSQSQSAQHDVVRDVPRGVVTVPRRDEPAKPVEAAKPERVRNIGGRLMV